MNPKPIMRALQSCSSKQTFAVLKTLETNHEMTNKTLLKFLGYESRSVLTYHLRKLKKYNAISMIPTKKMYHVTKNGLEIIHILEGLCEKHITNNPEAVCINNVDNTHDFITICKNCGRIKNEPKIKVIQ